MKRVTYTILALSSVFLLTAGTASATSFGANITIYDGTEDASHTGINIGREDQETEPGMVNSQIWDLEGFFQSGNQLSMVGGYNFATGQSGYLSGDIFISTDAFYGSEASGYVPENGNNVVDSSFGYEYVIDLNFDLDLKSYTYEVLALDPDDTTETVFYSLNEEDKPGSNPWQYVSGGEFVCKGSFGFVEGLTDTGFAGDTHYALTGFDLSFLGVDQEFYSHFTMGCGNDNLMGHGTTSPVPEPATMLLFGTGIAGLVGARRRKNKK